MWIKHRQAITPERYQEKQYEKDKQHNKGKQKEITAEI